jgi:bifunctional DNA-binding transcriptional regulator/antitoxin component of YhaV-PrlF toxin-antitoxin module
MSSKGQVIIAKALREIYHWEEGQELIAIDLVAGCLKYQGTPKSLEDMEDAIRQGLEELGNGDN